MVFNQKLEPEQDMHIFCCCDFDLEPITLICELDVDILMMCWMPNMKFLGQGFQKLEPRQTGRQTHKTHVDRTHYNAAFMVDNSTL